MATTPTSNPIPSESPKDLAFNAGKVDEFVNSAEEAFSDRFGIARLTLAGIQAEADNVILSMGFTPVDSFEAGATITSRNQALHYLSNNNYYRWDGSLTTPKVVSAGSTPASSGGVATGSWVNITDGMLRTQLASYASGNGGELVAYKAFGTGAVSSNVKKKLQETVSALDYGLVGNGTIDDTPFIQAAIDSLGAMGGKVTLPQGYKILIDTNLTIKVGVSIVGPYSSFGNPGNNTSSPYGNMSAIIVNPSATISAQSGAGIIGVLAYRKGMTFPTVNADSFAGTFFTGIGEDVYIKNSLVLGFNKVFYSTGIQRPTLNGVLFDCNNGIHIDNCLDVAKIRDCHGWPFATIDASTAGTPGASITRSGNAYWLTTASDWTSIHGCFSYGYNSGYLLDGVNSVTISQSGADNTTAYAGSTGVKIINGCTDTSLVGVQVAAQDIGIFINTQVVANLHTSITGCEIWGNTSAGIEIDAGDVTITGGNIRNVISGVAVNTTTGKILIDGVRFNAISNLAINAYVANSNTVIKNCQFGNLAVGNNITNSNTQIPSRSATSTLLLSQEQDIYVMTSGVPVALVSGGWAGREIKLICTAAVQFNSSAASSGAALGMALKSGANYSAAANSVLTLVCTGTYWYEVSRTV